MIVLVGIVYLCVLIGMSLLADAMFVPHVCVFEMTAENPGVPVAIATGLRVVECSCKRRVIVGYGEVIPC